MNYSLATQQGVYLLNKLLKKQHIKLLVRFCALNNSQPTILLREIIGQIKLDNENNSTSTQCSPVAW